jgi:hypothetical protein
MNPITFDTILATSFIKEWPGGLGSFLDLVKPRHTTSSKLLYLFHIMGKPIHLASPKLPKLLDLIYEGYHFREPGMLPCLHGGASVLRQ